jgi:glutamate-1-semialdehyde 2,1-aminomutase
MTELARSRELLQRAQHYLPGGVDSPVRAFTAVGGTPPFMVRGHGSKIYDADQNQYIDYVCSWGPLVLGHAHPQVVEKLAEVAKSGTSFGAPTELEITLAQMIAEAMPAIEMLRFVNSGTEAAMSALRLARAFTRRDKIIKFAGCYHGHADGLLVKGGSGLFTLGLPASPGVPQGSTEHTMLAPYNHAEAVEQLFQRYPQEIAAVIVEPVAANMGVVLPEPGFLEELRRLTSQHGALLIFDEVITGFRLGYLTGRRLRGPKGHHGDDGPAGAGIPGRNALRQSAGDDGGYRDAPGFAGPGNLPATGSTNGRPGRRHQ